MAPQDELFFLIGADAFSEIHTWRRWEQVLELVTFIVASRRGHPYGTPPGARICRLDGFELPESSSAIRAMLATGRSDVPVPPTVLAYIRARHLYRN
jgi:nicotinate-nucleotide adenylyltransferase